MRVYTLSCLKGGVGKTTTALNLAFALAEQKRRTLVLDLDPQGNVFGLLGMQPGQARATLADVLTTPRIPLLKAIMPVTGRDYLWALPTDVRLSGVQSELAGLDSGRFRLADVLNNEEVRRRFDAVIIDTPPTHGVLSTNGIYAAHHIIVPVQCTTAGATALPLTLTTLQEVKQYLRWEGSVMYVVPTMFNGTRSEDREILASIRDYLAQLKYQPWQSQHVIRDRTAVSQAWRAHKPVWEYDPSSDAAKDYQQLGAAIVAETPAKEKGGVYAAI